jgi:hypothetical protein
MNQRTLGLTLAVGALLTSIETSSWAGEPIRFIRPNAGEKAPLRFNFAAEKIQSRESLNPNSLQKSSGGASAGGMVFNPKARSGAKNRRTWDSTDTELKPKSAEEKAEPVVDSGGSDSLTFRSLSGGNTLSSDFGSASSGTLGIGGSGKMANPNSVPNSERMGRFNSDNRSALRSLMSDSSGDSRSTTIGGLGGVGFTPNSGQLPPGSDLRRDGPGAPGVDANNALAPRSGFGLDPGVDRNSPLNNSLNDSSTDSRRRFDPSDRPLRSNFELPTRPR